MTGPSLIGQRERILELQASGDATLYGVNNTYQDFPLDHWIACDPTWHAYYGKVEGDFVKWHWDIEICHRYGYQYIEGRWGEGLSLNPSCINYGHSSGYQALGLAAHGGHDEIYLAGFDMHYSGNRHYFSGLSDNDGEYPEPLRKFSAFDKPRVNTGNPQDYSLFQYYETVAEQASLPFKVYNMTVDSAFKAFEFRRP